MAKTIKIGILKEGKTPPDKRVTLSPAHCKALIERYPNLDLVVQNSPIRAFKDEEYLKAGIPMALSVKDCDILIGVKEVPIDQLLQDKTYLFFSHTTKKQPYNKGLLQAVCDKGITLMDHELLANEKGQRVIAFGRFAGIVGAYNGLRAFCKQEQKLELTPAHECLDQKEMQGHLNAVSLSSNPRILLTGDGRVGKGAMEVLDAAGIKRVPFEEFARKTNTQAIYTVLDTDDMYVHSARGDYNRDEFYADPSLYKSVVAKKMSSANIYIACHYWNPKGPMLLDSEDLKHLPELKIIADISCDIKQPIASTVRASTISDPFFGYNPTTSSEVAFATPGSIGIMSVDNLPCELPRDSSLAFGQQFIDHVASSMLEADSNGMLKHATIVNQGTLTPDYDYLNTWLRED